MKDIFGIDGDEDDFLQPLSEENTAEVRRLIRGSLQYHSSIAAEMEKKEMEESPEKEVQNLNFYERLDTRFYPTAETAEFARFQSLPKKEREAAIAIDLEGIRRLLKEKENWMKTWENPTDGGNSESQSGKEVDDEEEEDEEDSDEKAAEVRRFIGGFLAAEMEKEEMEESPEEEERNLKLYERLNTRFYPSAETAEFARFQSLPKKEREAAIAIDLEGIRRLLKEKENWMEDPPATVAPRETAQPSGPSPAPRKRRTVAPPTVFRYATRSQAKNN